jgi:gas vesicle protein
MKLSSFCVGLGVGAALGILFAPKSGEETREEILGAIQENLDEASNKGRKLVRRAQKTVDRVIQGAQDRVKEAADAVEHRLA